MAQTPAVAVIGPRQCGKTTLVKHFLQRIPGAEYLDLELPSDRRKLDDPELYIRTRRERDGTELFCLDEVQRVPELFPTLRGLIDQQEVHGQFLLLGSASPDLLHQSSETLAGRIDFLELTPFLASEVAAGKLADLSRLWLRGGFPRSYLSADDRASWNWRQSFARTFLERDLPRLGIDLPPARVDRLWRMLAHLQGQLLNASTLGGSLGVTQPTIRRYLDILVQTFVVRLLEPLEINVKKRLVKSPKIYIRDAGILHVLADIERFDDLFAHPVRGASWEGLVIEQVIAALPGWRPSFYRTSNGAELDLVMSRGSRRLAFECKASVSPTLTRGFWNAVDDVGAERTYVVAPVDAPHPIREGIEVVPLANLMAELSVLP